MAQQLSYLDLAPIGYRSNGRPIYPILGAEDTPPAATAGQQAATAATAAATQAASAAAGTPPADPGFPTGVPLEQMTGEQREAYWKHYARRNEDRLKAYGNLTVEQLTELRDKASRHDALELELGTTADKAAAQAAQAAKDAARGEFLPAVITAKLEAAAARAGVSDDDLAKAVEFVDTGKFLDADGKVDTDKVKTFVATFAPAKGTQQQQKGPTVTGHGSSTTNSSGASTALTGAELFALRHPKKSA